MESFAIPWMDLRGSRLAVKLAPESEPTPKDFAEMIYTMHRCYHGHGDEVPFNWQMFKVDEGEHGSFMLRTAESILIPSTFIEALCAVAILEPANKDQRVGVPLRITAEMVDWGKQDTFMCLFEVDAWWGRQGLFDQYLAKYPRRLMTASTPDYQSEGTPPPPGSALSFHMESISSHDSVTLDDLPVPEGLTIDFTPRFMPGVGRPPPALPSPTERAGP